MSKEANGSHDNGQAGVELTPAALPSSDVRVYEYGVRLDPEAVKHVDDQILKARLLYNDIVAAMRCVHADMQAWVLDRAGDEAKVLHQRVDELSQAFKDARAANDDVAMSRAAEQRLTAWRELVPLLQKARKDHAADLRGMFYSQVGNKVGCITYDLRSKAVEAGLGWATANDILDRALIAWKASMKQGMPPRFARGEEKLQDTLTLQFTQAGGAAAARLLDGSHSELKMTCSKPAAQRVYGELRFRLGPAKADRYATGTWQYHRPVPEGAFATSARLVRKRVASKMKWAVQLVLRLPSVVRHAATPMAPLVAVHFGWAADSEGRRIAGIADAADPGLARLLRLPVSVEDDLRRASEIQGQRDAARDEACPTLKAIERESMSEACLAELDALRQLPPSHIAAKRFYRIQGLLRACDMRLSWLDDWVAADRKRWQASVSVARRARLRRRETYRMEAQRLARSYSAVVIEPLDLARAAVAVDPKSGKRSEFAKKVRAGRTVAALFELEREIRNACANYGTPLFEFQGETVQTCAHCGGCNTLTDDEDHREVVCRDCGARTDKKLSGAARAWQLSRPGIEDLILEFHERAAAARDIIKRESAERKQKMAQGRASARLARTSGDEESGSGSREA
jgi:hypothetical protein